MRRYHECVWTRLSPYVGDRVLEAGSALGSYTRFLRQRPHVVVADSDEQSVEILRRGYERFDNMEVRHLDWNDPALGGLVEQRFDTVLCPNTLEHLEDDDRALGSLVALLAPGGRLVLYVPALHRLYGALDRACGYQRRYERDEVERKLRAQGLEIEELSYFNVPGALLWYLDSRLLERRAVPPSRTRLANLALPWLRREKRLRPGWEWPWWRRRANPSDVQSAAAVSLPIGREGEAGLEDAGVGQDVAHDEQLVQEIRREKGLLRREPAEDPLPRVALPQPPSRRPRHPGVGDPGRVRKVLRRTAAQERRHQSARPPHLDLVEMSREDTQDLVGPDAAKRAQVARIEPDQAVTGTPRLAWSRLKICRYTRFFSAVNWKRGSPT